MIDLVFLHGAGDSAAVWEGQVDHFAHSATVHTVDLPGHGARLTESAHEDHRQNARELLNMLRSRGLDRPVLVGHSMGGAIVMRLALDHPDVPRALVLVATGARLRMRPDFLETARQRVETMPAGQPVGAAVHIDDAISPGASADARGWIRERTGRGTAQAVYADFSANDRFDVMSELESIRAPALVVGGQDDRLTPPKYLGYLAEHIPNARLEMISGAGHYVFVERADAFNRVLEAFLKTLEP